MRLDSFVFSSAGGRGYNEDAAGEKVRAESAVYVLADGLGGHLHSEQAAQAILRSILEAEAPKDGMDSREWVTQQIETANKKVLDLQAQTHMNMKSTLVCLLIRGREALWANVGDSRIYYLHKNELAGVTEDHSVAYKKYKAGEITRAQIATDDDQSALLQALGNPERHIPSFYAAGDPLEEGDAFLLCSDGVWEYLNDAEVLVDLLKSESARDWGEHLLLRVISRIGEGNDNLSLVTVLVGEEDE